MFRRLIAATAGLVLAIIICSGAYVLWYDRTIPTDPPIVRADKQNFAEIERGRYLTTVADCAACHSGPGTPAFAGGRPVETPFGIILAPNITPDRETGIGAWSDADFDRAMRQGKGRDGSLLYPAMPFPYYTKMSRDDIRAIRAYLNTTAPARNKVTTNQLPFPFSIRASMNGLGRALFCAGRIPTGSAQNRRHGTAARILSRAPAIAAPAIRRKRCLGATRPLGRFKATPFKVGSRQTLQTTKSGALAAGAVEDIAAYLKTGHNQGRRRCRPYG